MGAWDNGNFGNDDAMDFVFDATSKEAISDAILAISKAPQGEYLDSTDCCIALAAIEYIAAALGNPSADFPEEAKEWVSENKSALSETGMISQANNAIDKIKTNSELKEFWEETDEFQDWLNVIEGLKKRIS